MKPYESQTTPRYWARFRLLPAPRQEAATKQYELFRIDPNHPSLQLKPVGVFWSVRISLSYLALAYREDDLFKWFWIGPHNDYEQIVYRQ